MPIILNTMEDVKERIPSVFATAPSEHLSSRYVFTPTNEIVMAMDKAGWKPRKITSVKPSKASSMHVKHSIRFAPESYAGLPVIKGNLIPEIQIVNSHNGSSPLRVELGMFRFVCSNGLAVADSSLGQYKWRHTKVDFQEIKRMVIMAIDEFSEVSKRVEQYSQILLSTEDKMNFAQKTIEMVWNDGVFSPEFLLTSRRVEDEKSDLFTTYNKIQEHLTKGGVQYDRGLNINEKGSHRFATTRAIKSIDKDLQINLMLWGMMDNFAKNGKF